MAVHADPTGRRKVEPDDASPAPVPRIAPPVRRRLRVGAVDDPAEREAHVVADSVVAALAAGAGHSRARRSSASPASDGVGTDAAESRVHRSSARAAGDSSEAAPAPSARIRRSASVPSSAVDNSSAGESRLHRSAARAAGESSGAAPSARIRRSASVPSSTADTSTIRRYFVHTPPSGQVEGRQFQAQEKATDAKSFVDPVTGKTTVAEPARQQAAGGPQLRVSDDGRIAIEDTDLTSRQAKVFYAEPSLVKESNARLLETGSKYQLFMEQASAVRVPSKDAAPLHALARVLPRNVHSFDAATGAYTDQGMTMDVQATCDEVAQAIAHTGNIGDFPLLRKSITTVIGFGEMNTAAYLLARVKGSTPDQAVAAASNALQLGAQHDAERQRRLDDRIRTGDQQSLAQDQFLRDNKIVQTDEERNASDKATKNRMAGAIKADMEREIKEDIKDAYGQLLAQQPDLAGALSAELGINRHAMPEVGQAFGSIQMQAKDKRDWQTGQQRTLEEGGSWGSHYGGVVAKSGGDSVTLENYARNRENEGISDATSAMYYFQMYGSEKGQTWHETWANAERRVVNPLTQVMGQSHQDVWTGQLAKLPRLTSIGDDQGYAAALAKHQQAIRDATTRDDAMNAYRSGLLGLTFRRFQRYAHAAFDVAVDAGLAHFSDPFPLSYTAVMPKVDAWISAGIPAQQKGIKRLLTRKDSSKELQVEVLRRLRDAMENVHRYYADRFPSDALDRAAEAASATKPAARRKALDPEQAATLDQKVKDYFVATVDDVARYDAVKERGAHYAGEDVDASTNPMITQGRKAVNDLRGEGKTDAEIKSAIKAIFPSYSDADIDTYFLATNTPRVAYLDSTRRSDYQLTMSGSKIKQRGADFDTSGMFSNGAGAGYSIFVMGPRGDLYANEHRPGLFHHSSFLAGLPTAAAGELQVKKGKLQKVTNKSGHYHPGAAETYQVLEELKANGVPLSSFALSIKSIPSDDPEAEFNAEYKSARDFAAKYEKVGKSRKR